MNIDNITSRMKKISQDTMAEVQKMNEIRQLNSSITAEKKKIHSMYTEIGKKIYDRYREAPLAEFESEFASLNESFGNIETLRAQVRQVKGVTLCPNCNAEVGVGERFCSNCGSKMPEIFKIQEEKPVETEEKTPAADTTGAAEEPTDTDPVDTTGASTVANAVDSAEETVVEEKIGAEDANQESTAADADQESTAADADQESTAADADQESTAADADQESTAADAPEQGTPGEA